MSARRADTTLTPSSVNRSAGPPRPDFDPVVGQQVGRERLDGHTVRGGQLGAELLEPRAVAGDEHEVVTASGERDREGAADPGRRARDERDAHERSSAPATVAAVASTGSP